MSVLKIENLKVSYDDVPILKNINLTVEKGEILGIVGESGCGKTTLIRSAMMLVGKNTVIEGSIKFEDSELTGMSENRLREIRGNEISMIPQNALLAMDPTKTISSLFYETIRVHGRKISRRESDKEAAELMEKLLLTDPERILKSYPFELSGGMCQRVSIAAAMINSPKLMLGDEPTSALDVKAQLEVVKLMKLLRDKFGISLVVISHNMGVITQISDKIAVMYGGRIVELGEAEDILENPRHPYTQALMEAVPDMSGNISGGLDGMPPLFTKNMKGCPFAERCPIMSDNCLTDEPQDIYVSPSHRTACPYAAEKGGAL
ncbi:MAG: ABC transporter ATP-binding protein [Clostridiales bacterium]|nr:ABC transporter ATP-binding protein [Clostridiales bacterium]